MQDINIENTNEGVEFTELAAKNKLLHRYEARISEAYPQVFAAFFQFIDKCKQLFILK